MHDNKPRSNGGRLQVGFSGSGQPDVDSIWRWVHVPLCNSVQPDEHAMRGVLGLRVERDAERDERGHIHADSGCEQRHVHSNNAVNYGMMLETGKYKIDFRG